MSVLLDPSFQEPDGSDASFGFIKDKMSKAKFKAEYPDAELTKEDIWSLNEGSDDEWVEKEECQICEYYEKTFEEKELYQLSDGSTLLKEELEEIQKELGSLPPGVEIVQVRKSILPKIKWYKINGCEVLEETEIPGEFIPLIPVLGEEYYIEGKRILSGIVRSSMDSQRMYNFWAPLRLDTPLPTPTGWTTMGEVQAGDLLFDENGKPCKVLGTSPIHIGRDCFKITFDDGSLITADKEHRWTVEERGRRKTKTWDWSTKTLTTGDLKPGTHFIYTTKPLELPEQNLEIDPYLLGVWLGDGTSAEPRITAGPGDADNIRQLLQADGHTLGDNHCRGTVNFTVKGIRKQFTQLDLLGNKHVPKKYLRGSIGQRLALLQGLMDTDGSINKEGHCLFTNTNAEIRDACAELLRSLGIKASCIERAGKIKTFPNGKEYQTVTSWQFDFTAPEELPVFRLSRHLDRQMSDRPRHARRTKRHGIISVEQVESVPVKCVAIDTPTHLFLAGPSMIPTHNSSETETIALAPRAPFIGVEGQFEGHEAKWGTANSQSHAYLEYKAKDINGQPVGAPQRNVYEPPVQAITQARMLASDDLKATTGIYDAALGAKSNETSGIAIQRRNAQAQTSNFHLIENLTRSIRHTGVIINSWIPVYYDGPRVGRIIGDEGEEEIVKLNQEFKHKGQMVTYRMDVGKYDIAVETGPSFATKRQEAAAAMLDLTKSYPNLFPIIGDLMVKSLDIPGAHEMSERLKKVAPPGVIEDKNQKPIPPEVQAQLQQQQQMLEQMTQALNKSQDELDQKTRELESKERIEFAKMQVDLQKALAQLDQKDSALLLQTQFGQIQSQQQMQADEMRAHMQELQQRLELLDIGQPIEDEQNLENEKAFGGPQAPAMPQNQQSTGGLAPGNNMGV